MGDIASKNMTSSYYFRYRILDVIFNYHSSIDLYGSFDRSLHIHQFNGLCPYMDISPGNYKLDLAVNKVIENTKIIAWEI